MYGVQKKKSTPENGLPKEKSTITMTGRDRTRAKTLGVS